jgi:hypothetical protein
MKINALLFAILFAGSMLFVSCGETATEETPVEETTEEATETTETATLDQQVAGTWVMMAEDGTEKGFSLNADGTVAAINMADLTATQWTAADGKIMLTAPAAEGAEPVVTTWNVVAVTPETLTVNDGTSEIVLTKKM